MSANETAIWSAALMKSNIQPSDGPSQDYLSALDAFLQELPASWQCEINAVGHFTWKTVNSSRIRLPTQGWKLHISASPIDATRLIRQVLPELTKFDVSFKVLAAWSDVVRINSGEFGSTQVGKVVTVYPASDRVLKRLVSHLDSIWCPRNPPEIPSDICVSASGGLWIRYGVFSTANVLENSLGIYSVALIAPDGTLVPDERSGQGRQVDWAPDPPVAPINRRSAFDPIAPIELCGSSYLPLKVLAANLGCRVDLAIRLSDCRLAIIKTAIPGARCDVHGNDAVARLENEHSVLVALHGSKCTPASIALDRTTHRLAMEDVGGVVCTRLIQTDRLSVFPNIADAVADLHALGFVHRDLKLSNVLSTAAGIKLVDLEIAAAIGAPSPIVAGTDGYVPPEGPYTSADPSYDVFSVGSCLTHALLDYCPGRLPVAKNAGRQIGLLELRGLHSAAQIVRAALNPEPVNRPSARDLASISRGAMETLRAEWRLNRPACSSHKNARWAIAAAVDAGVCTRNFRVGKKDGHCWKNEHLLANFECEGINIGAAGIIIGLSSIDAALGTSQFADDIVGAAEWLASRPGSEVAHGLFTGNAGVAVALSLAGRRYGRPDLLRAGRERFELAISRCVPDFDLFSGGAGILWSSCLLSVILGEGWPLDIAKSQAARIRHGASTVDGVIGWPSDVQYDPDRSVYFGAAHGTAGIALALASWGRATGCEFSVRLSADAFESVYNYGLTENRKNILAVASGLSQPPHHWCHGVAGYLWCLLQAFGEPNLLLGARDWAIEAFVRSTPFLENPTLCHGMAGILETWRMLMPLAKVGDLAAHRVWAVVAVFRLLHGARDGSTVWSSEESAVVSPDLWVGFLGPAASLAMSARSITYPIMSEAWLERCATATRLS